MLTKDDTVRTSSVEVTSDIGTSLPSYVIFHRLGCGMFAFCSDSANVCRHVTPQLPLELLQRIFLSLVGLCYVPWLNGSRRPKWIEITYVCRYWRSAALDLRELWSSITSDLSITWSRVMIERSSPIPVHIIIPVRIPGFEMYTGYNVRDTSELLSTSSLRIRTLTLSSHPNPILNVLNSLCSPSMLQSLRLRFPDMGYPVDLPDSLYGGDAPYLHRLTFDSDAYIRVPLWLLANITHFTYNVCVSLGHLLEMLEAMPQLEVLCIVRLYNLRDPTCPPEDLPQPPPTKLPCLSLLSICDCIPNSFLMLSSCIDGPPTLRRHFFWQDWHDCDTRSNLSWAWWLSTLQPFVPGDSTLGASDGGLRVAQICGYECDSFEMWSRTYSESSSTAVREDALFLLRVDWSSRDNVNSCFPTPSLRFSHAAHIEDLTIAPVTRTWTGTEGAVCARKSEADTPIIVRWIRPKLFTDIPFVKTLRLYRGSYVCVSVLRALSSGGSIFPQLQRVIIINSSIHSGPRARPDGVNEVNKSYSVASCKFVLANVGPELMEVVNIRSGLEVVLAGCEVEEKMLDELRKRAWVHIGHQRVYE